MTAKRSNKVKRKRYAAYMDRKATFEGTIIKNGEPLTWPYNSNSQQLLSSQTMASSGFYFDPTRKYPTATTCYFCNKKEFNWKEKDRKHPSLVHHENSPSCSLASILSSMLQNIDELDRWSGDSTFQSLKKSTPLRLKTFINWPHEKNKHGLPKSKDLSENGFFYDQETSGDDRVTCMYCGLHLLDWQEEDFVLVEHQRESPNCYLFNQSDTKLVKQTDKVEPFVQNDSFSDENKPQALVSHVEDEADNMMDLENNFESDIHTTDKQENNAIDVDLSPNFDEVCDPVEISSNNPEISELPLKTLKSSPLPIEIIERDEIEEYLDHLDDKISREKVVTIPTIHSSELGKYFTELDVDDDDVRSSTFFNRSKSRIRSQSIQPISKLHENVKEMEEIEDVVKLPIQEAQQIVVDNYSSCKDKKTNDSGDEKKDEKEKRNDDHNNNYNAIRNVNDSYDNDKNKCNENDNDNNNNNNNNDNDHYYDDGDDINFQAGYQEESFPMYVDKCEKEPNLNEPKDGKIDKQANGKDIIIESTNEEIYVADRTKTDSKNDESKVQQLQNELEILKREIQEMKKNGSLKQDYKALEIAKEENIESNSNVGDNLGQEIQDDQVENKKNQESANSETQLETENTGRNELKDFLDDLTIKKPCEKAATNTNKSGNKKQKMVDSSPRQNNSLSIENEVSILSFKRSPDDLQIIDAESTKKRKTHMSKYKLHHLIENGDLIPDNDPLSFSNGNISNKIKSLKRKTKRDVNLSNKKPKGTRKQKYKGDKANNKFCNEDELKDEEEHTPRTGLESEIENAVEDVTENELKRKLGDEPESEIKNGPGNETENKRKIEVESEIENENEPENVLESEHRSNNQNDHQSKKNKDIRTVDNSSSSDDEILLDNVLSPEKLEVTMPHLSYVLDKPVENATQEIVNKGTKEYPNDLFPSLHMKNDGNSFKQLGPLNEDIMFTPNQFEESSGVKILETTMAGSITNTLGVGTTENIILDDILKNQSTPYVTTTTDFKFQEKNESEDEDKNQKKIDENIDKNNNSQSKHTINARLLQEFQKLKNDTFDKEIEETVGTIVDDPSQHLQHESNPVWVPLNSNKYKDFYSDMNEATKYVKEVLDSEYELLSDDLDGLLTGFIAEIPPEQLKMTIKEWIRHQEEQAVELVREKAEEMLKSFRADHQKALSVLESLPVKEEDRL